ncbi:MAG: N-(5'-phosphoribosyl)anthranilate isomerase [Bacteroidota bacterium]
MLKTKVKASSITNLTDARYFAAWEVQWLGFCLDPKSEDYIQPKNMNAIQAWVDGVTIVGEFELQSADEIATSIELLKLPCIQVGMFTSAEILIELNAKVPVIKEIVPPAEQGLHQLEELLDEFVPYCSLFLLQLEKIGISWNDLDNAQKASLQALCATYPIILSMAIEATQLDSFLEAIKPVGLNVKGGVEEKVGYKSFDELDDLFEAMETFAE